MRKQSKSSYLIQSMIIVPFIALIGGTVAGEVLGLKWQMKLLSGLWLFIMLVTIQLMGYLKIAKDEFSRFFGFMFLMVGNISLFLSTMILVGHSAGYFQNITPEVLTWTGWMFPFGLISGLVGFKQSYRWEID